MVAILLDNLILLFVPDLSELLTVQGGHVIGAPILAMNPTQMAHGIPRVNAKTLVLLQNGRYAIKRQCNVMIVHLIVRDVTLRLTVSLSAVTMLLLLRKKLNVLTTVMEPRNVKNVLQEAIVQIAWIPVRADNRQEIAEIHLHGLNVMLTSKDVCRVVQIRSTAVTQLYPTAKVNNNLIPRGVKNQNHRHQVGLRDCIEVFMSKRPIQ